MELKQQTRFRFQSGDADDIDSVAVPVARAHKPGSSSSTASSRKSNGSSWLSAPVMLVVLALLSLVTLARMWQFSFGGVYHPPLTTPFETKRMVQFTTKLGTFTLELFPEHAPKSVETFEKLVDQGFYGADTGFYRNEPNFVLQGGGYLAGKKSPLANVPVEYSLPSTERMVVIARGRKATSGSSEFAIMLHDNTESNKPTEDSPGYTVFARVVAGWHTIQQLSKTMRAGYLPKDDVDRQVAFQSVAYVDRVTHASLEARKRLEELTYVLETAYTVVIFSEPDCAETKELKTIFAKLKAAVRVAPIGSSDVHPYEREAIQALTGRDTLPLVYINEKLVGGLADVQALNKDGRLQALLERSGALAEPTVWNAITQYPLVVFSKSYCPYCKKAKETLAALGAKPFVFELDLRQDGPAIQAFLLQFTHQATVPNVFIKGKSIGGSDDTLALYKSGELKEKLSRAGAI